MQLLFSARETIATLVKYKCKTSITLTPVCFTSHTLNSKERNYAQIKKECLAIVSCMYKWHCYLYGKYDITVHSDRQQLETISKKPLSKAPRTLQRMTLKPVAKTPVHRPIQERDRTFCSRYVVLGGRRSRSSTPLKGSLPTITACAPLFLFFRKIKRK